MKTKTPYIPYSVLDLATVAEDATLKETFARTLELARHTEKLGYKRYWLSEHHNMISVASSATSLLIGYVAGGTSKMRVGSGGIMLPNHSPLAVAEQFGTLESIYPGRIDLGLGRAPGTDQMTAMELRNGRYESVNDFPENILKLQTYFSKENHAAKVRAIPGEGQDIPIWILGSSTDSAQLAAYLGLPYAFATHFAPAQFNAATEIYKQTFRPSTYLKKPYMMACVNVVAADTDEEANKLATSLYQMFIGIITGRRKCLQPPVENMDDLWNDYEKEAAKQMLQFSFIGNKETLKAGVKDFLNKTGMNELMAITNIYSQEAKLHSYKLLAEVMNEI